MATRYFLVYSGKSKRCSFVALLYVCIAASCFVNYSFLVHLLTRGNGGVERDSVGVPASLSFFVAPRELQGTSLHTSPTDEPPKNVRIRAPLHQEKPLVKPAQHTTLRSSNTTTPIEKDHFNFKIDIISVGSNTRLGLMEVQRLTWAKHQSVRHFFSITEESDIEADRHCYQELSMEAILKISDWCRDTYVHSARKKNNTNPYSSPLMTKWMDNFGQRRWLEKKDNPVGWMCAQRRFARGIGSVLERYNVKQEQLPDFMLLVDDDTYVNLDLLQKLELQHRNPSTDTYVAAGCRITQHDHPMTNFAYGGFGQIYSRKSLERLIQPLHCSDIYHDVQNDAFQSNACKRISENLIGEREYFHDGMSVADLLLDARVTADPYTNHTNWNHGGFCFHADHYLANLVSVYGISSMLEAVQGSEMIIRKGSNTTSVKGTICHNERKHCDADTSVICHYQSPSQMIDLYQKSTTRNVLAKGINPWRLRFEPTARTSDVDPSLGSTAIVASEAFDVLFTDTKKSQENMVYILSRDRARCYEGVFHQLDEEWAVYVGGFEPNYASACNIIQVMNIREQRWARERKLKIPKGFPQTHQAVSYDPETKFLYIAAGQMGGGCNVVSSKVFRVHFETGETQILPDLPAGRYAAGSVIVRPPTSSAGVKDHRGDEGSLDYGIAHLHFFGGASPLRNLTAREHWRLAISDAYNGSSTNLFWEELEPTPDSNSHAVTFEYAGYLYHGSALNNDFGMQPTESIDVCRRDNPHGVDSHHTAAIGAMYRYASVASNASPLRQGHWERIQDMPLPAGQALVVKIKNSFLVVGGSNTHEEDGSTGTVIPNKWVRAFHPDRQEWDVLSPLAQPTKFGGMAWYDSEQESVFVVRYNNNRPKRPMWNEGKLFEASKGTVLSARKLHAKYLLAKQYRGTAVKGFRKCIENSIDSSDGFKEVSFLDEEEYEEARKTWNLRKNHLQVPDLVTFPKTSGHVGAIVRCAKRNGYKVCGRNGKHSFEGDSCAFGIVVDTSNFNQIELLDYDQGAVRLGAGLRLGQVAVAVEDQHKLVFPMGHCATVGLTGLMLVGGQGVLSRHFGMTIDYIHAIELVDEEGNLIRATESNNTDYFWLAKGGGSGVQHFPGIITAVETTGLPKPEPKPLTAATGEQSESTWGNSSLTASVKSKRDRVYTSFEIHYQANADTAANLIMAWQQFYNDIDHVEDPLFTRLTVEPWMRLKPAASHGQKQRRNTSPDDENGFEKQLYLACYFYGNDDHHEQFMEVYYPKLVSLLNGQGEVSKVTRMSNIVFHRRLSGVRTNKQLVSGQDGWDVNKRWKGYSAVAHELLPEGKAFRILAESIYESEPLTERYVEIKPLGGAISSRPKDSAAFWHRDAKWWLLSSHFMLASDFEMPDKHIKSHFDEQQEDDCVPRAIKILRNSRARHDHFLREMGTSFSGFYAGYIDHGSSIGRDLELYYGDHAENIAAIKKKRDPHNVFHLYLPNAMDESWDYVQSQF